MSDLEILEELFHPEARILVENYHGKGRATLVEPSCPESQVTIYGLPLNSIILKVDLFDAPRKVFRNQRGECKRADYAIIAPHTNITIIVHLEIKSSTELKRERIRQLKGALCFMEFCRAVGREFWDEKLFLNRVRHRFVSFTYTSAAKRMTVIPPETKIHDRPDQPLCISGTQTVQFKNIA